MSSSSQSSEKYGDGSEKPKPLYKLKNRNFLNLVLKVVCLKTGSTEKELENWKICLKLYI